MKHEQVKGGVVKPRHKKPYKRALNKFIRRHARMSLKEGVTPRFGKAFFTGWWS